mgnify:CR=1 FL=1
MKPLKIAMMSMTHGHTRKYYQVLKENPKLDWVAVSTANDEVKKIFLNSVDGIPCYDSETEMLALNIYNSFYSSVTNMGVGQAKAVIFFVIVVIISLIQLYFTKRKEMQQ